MNVTFVVFESPLRGVLPSEEVMFGRSTTTNTIQRRVEKAANANIPVLLQGECGADKEIQA
jgi:DNA-binding NtrC family response regulator